jgi:hypothetical protein
MGFASHPGRDGARCQWDPSLETDRRRGNVSGATKKVEAQFVRLL